MKLVHRPQLLCPPVGASLLVPILLTWMSTVPAAAGVHRHERAAEFLPNTARPTNDVPLGRGFVIVDGEYIPAPYAIRAVDGGVEINGRTVLLGGRSSATVDQQTRMHLAGRRSAGRGGWREHAPEIDPARAAERDVQYVKSQLQADGVVIAQEGKEASFLFHPEHVRHILVRLLGQQSPEQPLRHISHSLVSEWEGDWVSGFVPSAQFVERASEVVARIEAGVAEVANVETGIERLSMMVFPLTIVGMMLSVFASGHLVSYPPRPLGTGADAAAERISQRATVICLLLLIALSGLDLAWTLLASQAGQMIELNPLGSRMIGDPKSLIAFKTTVTLASCGILFVLRERQAARLASWWLCLSLTLLTFRWLVFNSMQVA